MIVYYIRPLINHEVYISRILNQGETFDDDYCRNLKWFGFIIMHQINIAKRQNKIKRWESYRVGIIKNDLKYIHDINNNVLISSIVNTGIYSQWKYVLFV